MAESRSNSIARADLRGSSTARHFAVPFTKITSLSSFHDPGLKLLLFQTQLKQLARDHSGAKSQDWHRNPSSLAEGLCSKHFIRLLSFQVREHHSDCLITNDLSAEHMRRATV